MADAAYYRDLLRPVFAGRKWILVGGPVVALAGLARTLVELGAKAPFLLGEGIGTGALPEAGEASWFAIEARGSDFIAAMRDYEAKLVDLPPAARDALERWDPGREAAVLGGILLGEVASVAGRPRLGARPGSWARLEDKVEIDAFWDAHGVRRAPSEVVALERSPLRAAARRLDRGAGTVWAGDARSGIHGGAVGLRWVRSEDDAAEAQAFFAEQSDRVRVMPFLEGIPCSIQGIVFPAAAAGEAGIAVFRPIEMVTFRRPGGSRLVYAGFGSFFDPSADDREALRSLARRVGAGLRQRVGFRGAYTIDGILAEQGFVPTELNARMGASMRVLAAAARGLPLPLVALTAAAGETLDWQPEGREELVVEAADARRGGGGHLVVPRRPERGEERRAVFEGRGYRLAREGEDPDTALGFGPSSAGGFVFVQPDPRSVPVGPSIAPRVAAGFALCDRELGTGIGPLETARAVR